MFSFVVRLLLNVFISHYNVLTSAALKLLSSIGFKAKHAADRLERLVKAFVLFLSFMFRIQMVVQHIVGALWRAALGRTELTLCPRKQRPVVSAAAFRWICYFHGLNMPWIWLSILLPQILKLIHLFHHFFLLALAHFTHITPQFRIHLYGWLCHSWLHSEWLAVFRLLALSFQLGLALNLW